MQPLRSQAVEEGLWISHVTKRGVGGGRGGEIGWGEALTGELRRDEKRRTHRDLGLR